MTPMTPIDPQLTAIITQGVATLGSGGGALPAPGDDASRVAAIRARHDAAAMAATDLVDRVHVEELGPDPIGVGDAPVETSWDAVDVDGATVGLRVYRPAEAGGALPVVVFVHGGAFWMGGGATGWHLNDALCRRVATGVGALVVGVDHRLAPEHPYPTPLLDVVAAIEHVVATAPERGGDPTRLAFFGISSGGNLAAAAAGRALDGRCPAPSALVLQVPSMNLSVDSGRFSASPAEVAGARRVVDMYTAGHDPLDPDVSPGLRPDLAGMPPTLLVTAEFDALTADALAYVERLRAAGVDVTSRTEHMTHTVAPPAVFRGMNDAIVAWLARTL